MQAQKCLIGVLLFFFIEIIASQDLLSSGATLSLGDVSYYISDEPFASGYGSIYTAGAGTSKVAFGLLPVTVVDLGPAVFSLGTLERNIVTFEKKDDVWSKSFLAGEKSRLKTVDAGCRSVGVDCMLNPHCDSCYPARYISRQFQY